MSLTTTSVSNPWSGSQNFSFTKRIISHFCCFLLLFSYCDWEGERISCNVPSVSGFPDTPLRPSSLNSQLSASKFTFTIGFSRIFPVLLQANHAVEKPPYWMQYYCKTYRKTSFFGPPFTTNLFSTLCSPIFIRFWYAIPLQKKCCSP